MKAIFITIAVTSFVAATLSGCAEMNAARAGVVKHGAMAMDTALEDAKWVTCSATSIGALERELGGDQERAIGWMLYCGKKAKNVPPSLLPGVPPAVPQSFHQRFQPQSGYVLREIGEHDPQ
jgi:hypothetical protein